MPRKSKTLTSAGDVVPYAAPQATGRGALIASIERTLRDPKIELERVRFGTELIRDLLREEAENRFDEALAAAQAEMEQVRNDASNPETKSRYATLAQVDRKLRPVFTRHKISVSFDTGDPPGPEMVRVVAYVAGHGHRRQHHVDMPADGKGPKGGAVMTRTHATMSAITYGRRALLLMIFHVPVGGEDDDGNAAGKVVEVAGPISADQLQKIRALLIEATPPGKQDAINVFLEYWKTVWPDLQKIEEIPAAGYHRVVAALQRQILNQRQPEKPK